MPRKGKMPTVAEKEERVEHVERLLASGTRKGDIKREIREAYGVCTRTVENYIARAKSNIRKRLEEPTEEHKSNSLAFYLSIIADPFAKNSDRIKAQTRIDKILGLESPQKHEVTERKTYLELVKERLAEFEGMS